jgi:hypothetical protein
MQDEYLIHKAGRGWYRMNAEGYTNYRYEAGRFTREQAESYTHPNGPDGPRDGLTYEPVTIPATRADPALAAAQAEVARYKVAMIVAGAEIDAHKAEVVRLTAEVARLRGAVTIYKRGYGPGDGDSAAHLSAVLKEQGE